ncbi:MAG TPA: hypothetical protein VFE85_05790 [Woeseiaceae bacterium]|nr:hypothetical protein [Woeseiaceae bacterium]
MLTVSEDALQHFGKTIADLTNSSDGSKCLRLVRSEDTGLALSLERPAADDTTFDYRGRTVLALPEEFADLCSDKQLDLDDKGNLTLG